MFDKNFGKEITSLCWLHRLRKSTFSKHFCPHKNENQDVKFLLLEESFENNAGFVRDDSGR